MSYGILCISFNYVNVHVHVMHANFYVNINSQFHINTGLRGKGPQSVWPIHHPNLLQPWTFCCLYYIIFHCFLYCILLPKSINPITMKVFILHKYHQHSKCIERIKSLSTAYKEKWHKWVSSNPRKYRHQWINWPIFTVTHLHWYGDEMKLSIYSSFELFFFCTILRYFYLSI